MDHLPSVVVNSSLILRMLEMENEEGKEGELFKLSFFTGALKKQSVVWISDNVCLKLCILYG